MGRRRRSRRSYQSNQPLSSGKLTIVLGILVLVNLYVFLWRDKTSIPNIKKAAVAKKAALGTKTLAHTQPPVPEPAGLTTTTNDFKVQPGDSLGAIFDAQGLPVSEQTALLRSLQSHLDFRKIRAGQKYQFTVAGDGNILGFTFHQSRVTRVEAIRSSAGEWSVEEAKKPVETQEHEIVGQINYSLYQAMKERGEHTSLIALFIDMFDYDINFFTDQHPGDEFKIIVEKNYVSGDFIKYGKVLAAEFDGKVGNYRAYSWQIPGTEKHRYFTEDGKGVETNLLRTPLKFTRVSSKFNRKRMHPVLHRVRAHLGTDYAAPTGTPVRAAASGKIVQARYAGGAGLRVIIDHGGKLSTRYLHLSKLASGIRRGKRVRQKDIIGYVGSTGTATGPHLHFEVRKSGRAVDPLRMKMTRSVGVPAKHMEAFKSHVNKLKARLDQMPSA